MGKQCIPPSIKKDKKYKELQAKYDASHNALSSAFYDWLNKYDIEDFNIDDPKLEEFLDEYFQIKSNNFFSDKKEFELASLNYSQANNQSNYSDKIVISSKEKAKSRLETRQSVFTAEHVVMYENQEGKFIIRIGKPIFKKEAKQEKPKENSNEKSKKESQEKQQKKAQEDSNIKNNKVQKAYDKLQEAIKLISGRVKLNPVTHIYTIYDSLEDAKSNKLKNPLKATSVSRHLYGSEQTKNGWKVPSTTLGNTNDVIVRDYFEGKLKNEYPNLTKKQLNALIEDLKTLESHFKTIHGNDCIIITEEFPIAAAYTVIVNGKPEVRYMAGTMDMIVIDSEGKYHIYDMKAKRSGLKNEDKVNYGNQMGLYGNMLKAYGIEVEDYHVILSDTGEYTVPIEESDDGVIYTVEDSKNPTQLYVNGVPIQESDEANYDGITLYIPGINIDEETLVPVKLDTTDSRMTINFEALDPADEYESLSKEEKELLAEEVGVPTKKRKKEEKKEEEEKETKTNLQYKNTDKNKPTKSGLYDPLLSAEERRFLAEQVMYSLSHIVTQLQTSKEANNGKLGYFPEGSFASKDFTTMSRQDIIDTIGVGTLFNLVVKEFKRKRFNSSDVTTRSKLKIAIDNFDDLIEEGYSKLISLEQVATFTISNKDKIIEDMGNDNVTDDNDTSSLEEKEREYWQLGQRNISAKASLSKEIRRMLEKLPVLTSEGDPVVDKYGFGFNTYVDSDLAVNSILTWCNNCTTIEEMEAVLESKKEAFPWLNTVLELIKDEPMRSKFFQNFRKDFTQYSVVIAEKDSNGKMVYKVHVINTKGVTNTILNNLKIKFSTGSLQGIIVTNDEFDGLGAVNVKNVSKIKNSADDIKKRINKAYENKKTLNKKLEDESVNIASLLNELGIDVLSSTVYQAIKDSRKNVNTSTALRVLNKITNMCDTLLSQKDRTKYNPVNKNDGVGNLYGDYKQLVNMFEEFIERSIEACTYEGGKMYYSFVNPSYTGKVMLNLKNAIKDENKFDEFIENEYKRYRWFWDSNNGDNVQWNNMWLQLLTTDKETRDNFDHKVQLTFNKTPYKELSELGYTLSLMQEYFYDKNKKWAWYRVPILSNKPSAEFIKFRRFTTNARVTYKDTIKVGLKNVFNQEILRIKTVLERAAASLDKSSGIEKILNYDIDLKLLNERLGKDKLNELLLRIKNKKFTAGDYVSIMKANRSKNSQSGAEFRFLEAFSEEIINNTEAGKLIIKKLNDNTNNKEEARLHKLIVEGDKEVKIDSLLDTYMNRSFENAVEEWKTLGLFETVERTEIDSNNKKSTTTEYKYLSNLVQGAKNEKEAEEQVMNNLEEYFWNDMFATINIIQLTTTDLAYYKNSEDFQKRIAQIHSPGLKLNVSAVDSNGVKVSIDGMSRTIYIDDKLIVSEILDNIAIVFDRKIEKAPDAEKENLKKMKDFILSSYKNINITDGQAYNSPTSYRKKMIMAGKWDSAQEEAYQRIIKGDYNINDLDVLWQPIKPFTFSQIAKSTGVDTMSEIKLSVQNKNSEYLLLMADAIMRSGGMHSTLGAIFDFMEDSARDGRDIKNGKEGSYNGIGIDTVQFGSTTKVGLMGVIDINNIKRASAKETHDAIIAKLNSCIYRNRDKTPDANSNNEIYNDQYVHTVPFEDYSIQQEVPAHLVDHFQSMGSQVRILSISDILEKDEFEIHNVKGTKDGKWIRNRYQQLIAENIEESFKLLEKELKLETKNRKERNKALSNILVKAIKKDQKYGNDLLRACKLNSEDEFNIPLSDPIQARRVQELINSIIKSNINKQLISGGPVVQATSYGLSQKLNIVFKDRETGEPMVIPKNIRGNKDKEKAWLEEHQGGMSHMEVYMPVPSKELEEALTKPDGTLMSVEEALDNKIINEEMLKAIAYRIPTEDKYSILPIKIVGWMPRAAGEVIMMPEEITLLTGSDFDVDKMYIMLKEFKYNRVDKNTFIKNLEEEYRKHRKQALSPEEKDVIKTWASELFTDGKISTKYNIKGKEKFYTTIKRWIENRWATRTLDEKNGAFYEETVGNDGESTRASRNNEIFDIQWAVLTHESTAEKMFNPGNFEEPKKTARIIEAAKAGAENSYSELSDMSIKELNNLASRNSKNILFSTTQVAYHRQNMTAGKLIGVFANNNTAHAFLSMHKIHFQLREDEGFTINGITVDGKNNNKLDEIKAHNGSLISKNLASLLAASVDAVKDPVLNFLNLNTFTCGPAMVLTRLGFDIDTIGLIMSQPIIEKITREYFKRNNDGYVSVEEVINDEIQKVVKDSNELKAFNNKVTTRDFTSEKLLKHIKDSENIKSTDDFQLHVLGLFKRLSAMSVNMNNLTFITKFNSISNAVGPTIADTLVMEDRYQRFLADMEDPKTAPFNDAVKELLFYLPIQNAFYSKTMGPDGIATSIFKEYFTEYSPKFTEVLSALRNITKSSLDSKTINKLVNEFILYKMTVGENPILSGHINARIKFIKDFPRSFEKRAAGILDNDLINAIVIEARNNKCPVPTLKISSSRFSVNMQERIRNAWTSLIENEDTFKLGRDLFLYNLYRNGFSYSPKTFLHFFSVDAKLNEGMESYLEAISNPEFNDDDVHVNDFLMQFLRNHSSDRRLVPELKYESIKNKKNVKIKADTKKGKKTITLDYSNGNKNGLNSIIVKNNVLGTTVFAPIIVFNNKLYYAASNNIAGENNSIVYIETTELGKVNNFLEYDANNNGNMVSAFSFIHVKDTKNEQVKDNKNGQGENDATDTEDTESSSKSDDEVNHDAHKDSPKITDKELKYLFNEDGILSEYRDDVLAQGEGIEDEDEATEIMTDTTLDLLEEYVGKTKKLTEARKKALEILKRFCRNI